MKKVFKGTIFEEIAKVKNFIDEKEMKNEDEKEIGKMTNFEKATYTLLKKEAGKEKYDSHKVNYLHDILFKTIEYRLKKGNSLIGVRKGFIIVEINSELKKVIDAMFFSFPF